MQQCCFSFCVEAAVLTGATKSSSASLLSKWNTSAGIKSKLFQKPISETTFDEFNYRKASSSKDKTHAANWKYKCLDLQALKNQNYLKIKIKWDIIYITNYSVFQLNSWKVFLYCQNLKQKIIPFFN